MYVGAQSRRAAQSRRIGENRRTAQSRRAGPMSPCHVIAKLSHRKRIVVHILNKLIITSSKPLLHIDCRTCYIIVNYELI